MPLDPNWFYSTLAQSTAAIVGLGGGFLVQRILQQRNDLATPRSDILSNVQASFKELRAARDSASRIATSLGSAAEEGREAQRAGAAQFRVTQDVSTYSSRQQFYGRGNGLPAPLGLQLIEVFDDASRAAEDIRDALPADFKSYVKILETAGELSGHADWLDEDAAPIPQPSTSDSFLDDVAHQHDHLRYLWQNLQAKARTSGRELRAFRDRLVPASFYWLLGVIAALLIVGTIMPMLYLSVRSEGSRALLLIPFALLALAFFGFIAGELRRLRAAGDMTSDSF